MKKDFVILMKINIEKSRSNKINTFDASHGFLNHENIKIHRS